MKKSIILLLTVLAGAATVKAQSQDTTARYFLIHASIGNLQEIAAGNLAVQQGATDEVKSFGKMMVNDHSKAESQLLQVAKSQHIMLPTAATDTPVPDLNLKKAQGKQFDQLFIHAMETAHRQTVTTFQIYAVTGKSPAVRAFAQQTLPTLKQHLMMVKGMDDKMEAEMK